MNTYFSGPLYLYLSPSIIGCGIYYHWRSKKGPIMTFQFVTGALAVFASFIIWYQYRNTRYQPSENKAIMGFFLLSKWHLKLHLILKHNKCFLFPLESFTHVVPFTQFPLYFSCQIEY